MNNMLPEYSTMTFNDVFPDEREFEESLRNYSADLLDAAHTELTWLLLSAKYGNSPIANRSVEQFKLKCWSIIFQYGPTWVKELSIQEDLRSLGLDELRDGTKATFNHAFNPETAPSTDTTDDLPYVNDQNVTKYKKSKLEAYAALVGLLDTNVTEKYINRFKPLFKQFVMPESPLLYISEGE